MVKRPGSLAIQTFSREDLAARAARGEIKRDWLVRTDAGGNWERMDEVFEAEWPEEIVAPPPAIAAPPSTPPITQHVLPVAADEPPTPVPAGGNTSAPATSRWTKAAMKRYRDAYAVARFMVATGSAVKGLGIVGGLLLMLLGMVVIGQGGFAVAPGIIGLILGPILGTIFFIWGIVLSARGQELQAELDVAVYESPFLSDAERATVMSL